VSRGQGREGNARTVGPAFERKLKECSEWHKRALAAEAELAAFRAEVLDVCSSATLVVCVDCAGGGLIHRMHHGAGGLRCENVTCATCGGSGLSLP
jgi:DnaJ-class molecular chaperone